GGSTITKQLAKNVFLTREKTVTRKLKEVAISLQLEQKYTKQQILEMYMNHIYFGHGAYGIQAAAKLYFNKNVEDLTVEEG
nr:transglycosylase domain-containing protein [Streptococcus oralis]